MSVTSAVVGHFDVEVVQDGPLSWKDGGDVVRVYECKHCAWIYEVMVSHPCRSRIAYIHGDGGEELRDHLMFGCPMYSAPAQGCPECNFYVAEAVELDENRS